MAKKLLTSYTFTPGAANVGTLVVLGTYTLEQFLLVTNVTTGATIYQFNKPTKGATLSTGGGNTTLTLEADTSAMSGSDRLQVFVDDATAGTSVNVSNTVAVTGPLTDIELRATAVPISGSVTATGPLTDTQLRASAVPVSAASLPLPTGGATSALQTTGNTSLNNLDVDLGAQADAVATTDTGTFSLIALVKRGLQNWTTLLGRIPSLTVTSTRLLVDGSGVTQPVSGTITANAGTNLNTSALALETGGNLASINTKIPAQGLAAPTASLPVVLPNKTVVTGPATQSALNTNLLTGNLNDWSDAIGYTTAIVTIVGSAGITAGQVTYEISADSTTSIPWFYTSQAGQTISLAGGITSITASSVATHIVQLPHRYWRARIATAFAGGTIQAFVTYLNQPYIPDKLTVNSSTGGNLSSNITQISSTTAIGPQVNGATQTALGVYPVANVTITDQSAQNVAAASGSLAVNNSGSCAPSLTFDVNLTAFTAGTSTGLDIYLQESPDNGTTFYDIWQCEAFTAAGRARIPALPVNGRRRIRWVNRTGGATTATLTVTSMGTSAALPIQRQFFDRTSGVGTGTAVLNTSSAAYDIAGCKAFTVVMQAGTATAVASFQAQMSMDGTNWYNASAATAIGATTANNTIIPITSGLTGRFIRVTCTAAGTLQTINAIHIYGTN